MASHRIAIVGGGLGGTLAGIMLQRAGHAVTIYEQAMQPARIGAGINLGANVMTIMRHVGLEERMNGIGLVPQTGASRVWDTGEVLFQRPYKAWAERFGAHHLIMHRGDLLEVLCSALQPGTVQFGKQLVGLETAGEETRLAFADGSQAVARVVIGADGVNSKVREILLGAEPPIYSGTVAYRAIFPTRLLSGPALDNDSTKWWSDERLPAREDRHFIIYYLTAQRDEIYFVTGSPEPDWDGNVASVPADMRGDPGVLRGLPSGGDPGDRGLPAGEQVAAAGARAAAGLEPRRDRAAGRCMPSDEAAYGPGGGDGVRGCGGLGAVHRGVRRRRAGGVWAV